MAAAGIAVFAPNIRGSSGFGRAFVHADDVRGRRDAFDDVLAYCLAKPGAWQDEPWEGDVVAKVGDKIFAFLGSGGGVGLKGGRNRDEADEWLYQYPDDASVMAYIGRSGWNTLRYEGSIPDDELREAIDASYEMVVAKLPKRLRPVQLP
jgi:predicted DNA-binding protein (MmcQ/YjbR family)